MPVIPIRLSYSNCKHNLLFFGSEKQKNSCAPYGLNSEFGVSTSLFFVYFQVLYNIYAERDIRAKQTVYHLYPESSCQSHIFSKIFMKLPGASQEASLTFHPQFF